jgi:hypothetical protein
MGNVAYMETRCAYPLVGVVMRSGLSRTACRVVDLLLQSLNLLGDFVALAHHAQQ